MECFCGAKFHATNQFQGAVLHFLNHIAASLHELRSEMREEFPDEELDSAMTRAFRKEFPEMKGET